ncbi:MAG: alcohol dehydrogenase catalytic domain-containing protein [Solobacterium sp.]|nr:alcohol dehydrogenase catalytic domain-containing protein [Solobacterium sp.]
MKAIQMFDQGRIELRDVPVPEINEDELLVRVRAASICGTDIRMWKNGAAHASNEHPLIPGHEFAGDIVKAGSNVQGFSAGDRVSVAPNLGCGHCDACVSGNTHLCDHMEAFGVTMDGGFAEYVRIPKEAVVQGNISKLGDDISYEAAALVEPLSCVYNGQTLLGIRPGDDVLIIGLGPIGIMHIMTARILGAGRIFVNDLSRERIDQACRLLPEVLPIYGDIPEGFASCGIKGVDICIIAAPAPDAQAASLEYMNMNGKLLFFGGLPDSKKIVPINTNLIHYRQLTIQGCTRQSISEYRKCAKLVNDGRIPLDLIMSDSYPIEEYETAYQNAAQAKGLKHVFRFDGTGERNG